MPAVGVSMKRQYPSNATVGNHHRNLSFDKLILESENVDDNRIEIPIESLIIGSGPTSRELCIEKLGVSKGQGCVIQQHVVVDPFFMMTAK